ncbi:MAG: ABC transporter ATP-binding protein [Lachnospirales bacterium]
MLKVNNLNVYYGAIHAIKNISFEVNQGEIVSLIGANGAGKTTTLHAVSGLLRSASGSVSFMDNDITKMTADKVMKLGLGHVPEGRRVFQELSVHENLMLGAFTVKDKDFVKKEYNKVMELFPRLGERRKQLAGTLSGGEQQMLAMGRALMGKPSMILMDEPSMGLAPILVNDIFSIIKECNKDGTTILLVEQNANMALSISDRAYVLETGKIVMEGKAKELMGNDDIRKAYLGG